MTSSTAQKRKANRAKRLAEVYEGFPAKQINMILSAQAAQALQMLASYRKLPQRAVIEDLLIQAYTDYKTKL